MTFKIYDINFKSQLPILKKNEDICLANNAILYIILRDYTNVSKMTYVLEDILKEAYAPVSRNYLYFLRIVGRDNFEREVHKSFFI